MEKLFKQISKGWFWKIGEKLFELFESHFNLPAGIQTHSNPDKRANSFMSADFYIPTSNFEAARGNHLSNLELSKNNTWKSPSGLSSRRLWIIREVPSIGAWIWRICSSFLKSFASMSRSMWFEVLKISNQQTRLIEPGGRYTCQRLRRKCPASERPPYIEMMDSDDGARYF